MPVDYKTAQHICKVITRQIESGYPDLTLTFIVHEEHKRQKALVRETENIQEHPAGQTMLDYIHASNDKEITGNRSGFVGLAQHNTPGFLGFFRSTATIGLFFINCDRFTSQEDFKNHALHMAWHALALYDDLTAAQQQQLQETGSLARKNKHKRDQSEGERKDKASQKEAQETSNPSLRFENSNGITRTKLDIQQLYHRNLLADIFSASFQALQGSEDAIRLLATQRMTDTLTPQIGFISEKYPYPISIETLEFLFSESMRSSSRREKGASMAVQITREIGMTYKINAIKQWKAFCTPAQEMAWCGFSPETILGAAIFTNENTYVRSIADMVSEHLGIKPSVFSSLNDYNPFADNETNKHLHEKLQLEICKEVMEKIRTPEDHKIVLGEAAEQCRKLQTGNPMGWSAHALLVISDEIMLLDPKTLAQQKQRLMNIYEQELQKVSWENLRSFARFIFRHRRDGEGITQDMIRSLQAKTDDINTIKETFARLDEMIALKEASKLRDDISGTSHGNFLRYANPNLLQ